ncbi:hypothetical protein HPB52_003752 [Rhipicephalus sanguineus]|uniref:Uncharacterized protein n=1 Tax=Rhipicephalus sanguineus TaxID=34632 RepID=A0A9D4PQ02_RHISA|nr:hypothetical protein HPB52_003752 [Rhipicephalus sanguineus]
MEGREGERLQCRWATSRLTSIKEGPYSMGSRKSAAAQQPPSRRQRTRRMAPRRPGPAVSAPLPSKPRGCSVATWTHQQGQEVPRFFCSAAPWKTQRRVRRDLPADRVPWPFRGCTVAEAEEAAGGPR